MAFPGAVDDDTHYSSSSSHGGNRGHRRPANRGKRDIGGTVGQATWMSSNVNLVNTIVGAGVLAMPLAVARMGMLLGIIIILWSGVTAGFGLYLQSRCAKYLERGSASFFALSQITYPNAAVIFDAAIAVKCFGVGVSYLIIIGDLMPGVVRGFNESADSTPFLVDRQFWITAFMLVVIPLSFLRRLDSLKYTSVIALISIGYLVILVVYHFAAGDTIDPERSPLHLVHWQGPLATLAMLPVVVFAYTCHQNMFSIVNEIADNSHWRLTSVVATSIGSAAFIYVLVAVTGYLSFGNEIGGNIVAQYSPSVSATIGRAAIVVLVMFSYPLQVHPCRASVDAVLKWRPIKKRTTIAEENANTPMLPAFNKRTEEMGELRFAAITTVIIILSYIVAMTVSSLDKVLAYVGSTGSTSISFILPGLFYYKISSPDSILHQKLLKQEDDYDADEEDDDQEGEGLLANSGLLSGSAVLRRSKSLRRKLLRQLSLALAIYGILVMIICLITNTFFLAAH